MSLPCESILQNIESLTSRLVRNYGGSIVLSSNSHATAVGQAIRASLTAATAAVIITAHSGHIHYDIIDARCDGPPDAVMAWVITHHYHIITRVEPRLLLAGGRSKHRWACC
jgi:hypothetical protein